MITLSATFWYTLWAVMGCAFLCAGSLSLSVATKWMPMPNQKSESTSRQEAGPSKGIQNKIDSTASGLKKFNSNSDLGDPAFRNEPDYVELLSELHDRYGIRTDVVSFGQTDFYFTKVADPNNVQMDFGADGELLWQPYWAEDWESSRALCWMLLGLDIKGKQLLDLGCGLGLTCAVAAKRNAIVYCADNAAPALEFSRINCWENLSNCKFRSVNWKSDSSDLPAFDLIVGAEIIYDKEDWPFLSKFWSRQLAADGRVLLCDPFRRTGREFRDWIQSQNWTVTFSDESIPDFEKPINVIELRKLG